MARLTNLDKENIKRLYEQGKMDSEISKELGIKTQTVQYFRTKNNMPTKFTYSKISKINKEEFEKLFYKGLSDYAIAKELNMSPDGIYSHRMRHNYHRQDLRCNLKIELSKFQKEVLLGTLLGDSSLRIDKGCKSPTISCAHSIKQKEYCEYKTKIFKNLGAHCKCHKRHIADKRNNKLYEDCTMYIPANPALKSWYDSFYKDKVKCIPFNLFKYFTPVSLAFMYMDDGSKIGNTYQIATNCFTKEEITKFRIFLLEKFNLETSMFKSHVLYIKQCSANRFTELIKPYIIPSMQYKLQSLNHVNLGKSGDR